MTNHLAKTSNDNSMGRDKIVNDNDFTSSSECGIILGIYEEVIPSTTSTVYSSSIGVV